MLFSGKAAASDPIKVAFIGDQGTHNPARSVLSLIASEGTDLLLILGDLGYEENRVEQWDANIDNALGRNFPVLTLIGNHEDEYWGQYKRKIKQRIDRVDGLSCSGEVGEKAVCRYGNIEVVQVSPGIRNIDGIDENDDFAGFIDSSFARSSAPWKICSWHLNQNKMQTGGKDDRTGWGVYDSCLNAGAMIATSHEHAYSRTYLMSDFENQSVVHRDSTMTVQPGQTFAFVSGLGGWSIREQLRGGDWWASVYTASQGATHGALFCTFYDTTADCYFKAVDGSIPDQFQVNLGTQSNPVVSSGPTASSTASTNNGEVQQPSSLRAEIYSSTAMEVFWNRASDSGLRYEVQINGERYEVTSGTSQYLDGLHSESQLRVGVIAVNSDGRRSQASTIDVSLSQSGSESNAGNVQSSGSPSSGGPTAPEDVYVNVYSSTSVEVFWARETGKQLHYDLSLNGSPIDSTDGTSSYISDMQEGQQYAISVVAIDDSGNRSPPATLSINTAGDSNTTIAGISSMQAPSNLRADIYSSSAFEVFWNRPSIPELTYVILLNGEQVSSTQGVSAYFDGLQGGRQYAVGLQAISPDGSRSDVTTIAVTLP